MLLLFQNISANCQLRECHCSKDLSLKNRIVLYCYGCSKYIFRTLAKLITLHIVNINQIRLSLNVSQNDLKKTKDLSVYCVKETKCNDLIKATRRENSG